MEKKLIVTINREFGSGGHEIGQGLAKALDIPFYDKEILKLASSKSGVMEEMFEKADEQPSNSFLFSLSVGNTMRATSFNDYSDYLTNDKLFLLQSEVIKSIAQKSSCVMIGRCSDYILRGTPGLFSVFIHAPLEIRIGRIARLHNIDEDAARSLIKKTDKHRSNYHSYYADSDWGAIGNYDLCLDAGKIGTASAIEMIKNASEYYSK